MADKIVKFGIWVRVDAPEGANESDIVQQGSERLENIIGEAAYRALCFDPNGCSIDVEEVEDAD